METPEGPACGLIKAFALGARVTLMPPAAQLKAYRMAALECVSQEFKDTSTLVLLNGDIIGYTEDAAQTVEKLLRLDAPGDHPYCSPSVYISPCDHTVHIHTEDGRVVRPLLEASKLNEIDPSREPCVTKLLRRNLIRYVDASEIATLDVALNLKGVRPHQNNQLLEVHVHLILGVTAGLIPLLQCNQSPRNAYHPNFDCLSKWK